MASGSHGRGAGDPESGSRNRHCPEARNLARRWQEAQSSSKRWAPPASHVWSDAARGVGMSWTCQEVYLRGQTPPGQEGDIIDSSSSIPGKSSRASARVDARFSVSRSAASRDSSAAPWDPKAAAALSSPSESFACTARPRPLLIALDLVLMSQKPGLKGSA